METQWGLHSSAALPSNQKYNACCYWITMCFFGIKHLHSCYNTVVRNTFNTAFNKTQIYTPVWYHVILLLLDTWPLCLPGVPCTLNYNAIIINKCIIYLFIHLLL